MRNLAVILEYDPIFEGAIRKNMLYERPDISKPLPWERNGTIISNDDHAAILLFLSQEYGMECDKILKNTLKAVANQKRFHPICEHLNNLKWDGIPRIRNALHHFLGAEINDANEEFLRVFMFGAVQRVFHPGCKFDLILCIVGGQGAGKSTFFRFLAIKDEWFSDALCKLNDENVYRWLTGHWLIEMSEMVALNRAADIEEIKAFITRQKDVYKTPYDLYPEDHPRQCVFCGTSNRMDFLPKDRTGNRRYLPIRINPANAECHILDDETAARRYIEQMWAEIMALYREGKYSLELSPEGRRHQAVLLGEFIQEDTRAGQIIAYMETCTEDKICSRQLFAEALDRKFDFPKDNETKEICEIVNNAIERGDLKGWRRFTNPRHFGKFGKQKGWERVGDGEYMETTRQPKTPVITKTEQLNLTPVENPPDFPF